MSLYRVSEAAVSVVVGASRQLLTRGSVLPEDVDQCVVEGLLAEGYIVPDCGEAAPRAEKKADPVADEVPSEANEKARQGDVALEDLNLTDLRAMAADRDIDLAELGATKKAEIIAALQANPA